MIQPQDMQVFEILEAVTSLPEPEQAAELRKYANHAPLSYILKFNYDASIVSLLPEGSPPFNSAEEDGPPRSSLREYLQLFPTFVRSGVSANMKMLQIEKSFIDMLEHIDAEEAEVVILAKDKNLESKYLISLSVVTEAFPNLISQPVESEVREITPEEKAARLKQLAEQKKEKAKLLNAEARELIKEAKQLEAV